MGRAQRKQEPWWHEDVVRKQTDEDLDFIEQIESNSADLGKLVSKSITAGGSPFVYKVGKEKGTVFSGNDRRSISPVGATQRVEVIPPQQTSEYPALHRVLAIDLSTGQIDRLLLYLGKKYPAELFFAADEVAELSELASDAQEKLDE